MKSIKKFLKSLMLFTLLLELVAVTALVVIAFIATVLPAAVLFIILILHITVLGVIFAKKAEISVKVANDVSKT